MPSKEGDVIVIYMPAQILLVMEWSLVWTTPPLVWTLIIDTHLLLHLFSASEPQDKGVRDDPPKALSRAGQKVVVVGRNPFDRVESG